MKFMLLCYDDQEYWLRAAEGVHEAAVAEALALTDELRERGQFLGASPLEPTSTATCVRVREGKLSVTDGPFAETNEVLGGYYLIDVPTLEDALAVARRHPGARTGCVEVRPLAELSNK